MQNAASQTGKLAGVGRMVSRSGDTSQFFLDTIAVVSVLLGFGHFRTGQANDSLRLTDPGVSVEEDIGKLEEEELSPS